MRHRSAICVLLGLVVYLLTAAPAVAATRTITGTLYRPNGTVCSGCILTAKLTSTFSNAGQTVVPQTWRVTANALGVVSLSILVPDTGAAAYLFTLPDGSTATATLGAGAAITLDTVFTNTITDPDDVQQAVVLDPTTTPRNVIQPQADVVPLTLAARAAGQTANLQEWKNATGTVAGWVSPAGHYRSTSAPVISPLDYGAVCDGVANDTVALAAMVAALPQSGSSAVRGATIALPNRCTTTAVLNLDNQVGIRITSALGGGQASFMAGLVYTGADAGSLISLNGATGIEIDHLMLYYTSNSYTGDLISMGSGTSDASGIHIHHNFIGGVTSAVTSAASLIGINDVVHDILIGPRNQFASAQRFIWSKATTVIKANNVAITHNLFNNRAPLGMVTVAGSGWTLDTNTFEAADIVGAVNTCKSIVTTATGVDGLKIVGGWQGDVTTGTCIDFTAGVVNGFGMDGGQWAFNSITDGTMVNLGAATGVTIRGAKFKALTAIVGGSASNVVIGPNGYTAGTTALSGTPTKYLNFDAATNPIVSTLQIGTGGVLLSTDNDGKITFLSKGDGSGGLEDFNLNLDDVADTAVFQSTTGVVNVRLDSMGLNNNGGWAISATGTYTACASCDHRWLSSTRMGTGSVDGNLLFRNSAGTAFGAMKLGGLTDAFSEIFHTPPVGSKGQGIIIQQADGTPAVFADLGAATNGSEIYCSDCVPTTPCAGGGTGAKALRLNGAWTCGADVSSKANLGANVFTSGSQVIPAGTGTATFKPCGTIHSNTTDADTAADTTPTTFATYTLPANTLATNGDQLEIEAWGSFAANTNIKTVALTYGGVTLVTDAAANNDRVWKLYSRIIRTASGAEDVYAVVNGWLTTGGTGRSAASNTKQTIATSSDAAITVVGTNGSAVDNDITFQAITVKYCGG